MELADASHITLTNTYEDLDENIGFYNVVKC